MLDRRCGAVVMSNNGGVAVERMHEVMHVNSTMKESKKEFESHNLPEKGGGLRT